MCVYFQQDGALAPPTAADRASSSFCASKSAEATGRAGSVVQRRRRLSCACLHPVDQAESPGAGGGVEPPARLQFENCTTRSGVHCRVCGLNVIARILTRRAETPKAPAELGHERCCVTGSGYYVTFGIKQCAFHHPAQHPEVTLRTGSVMLRRSCDP